MNLSIAKNTLNNNFKKSAFEQFFIIFVSVSVIYILLISYSFAGTSLVGGAVLGLLAPNPITAAISNPYDAGETPTGGTLCAIVGMMNSGIVRAISALGVIFIGISALFGQIKWTQALMLGVGIALMLGSASLVENMPDYKASGNNIAVSGIDASFSNDKVTCSGTALKQNYK